MFDFDDSKLAKLMATIQAAEEREAAAAKKAIVKEVKCRKCHTTVEIIAKHADTPLSQLKCGECKAYLAPSPITLEFCIWLQNEWADEISRS